ncbi:MAG: flavin reductase [Tabrizicola sp.]|nr:flavin reductase [Tabrizicola sp.]
MPVDPAGFRQAMARFPGAVTIVTSLTPEGERRGITATAVASVTADPPSLLVCLNRKTGTCAAVAQTGRFVVNLLPGDGGDIALCFAGVGGASGEAKFKVGDWREDEHGLPVLQGAVVSLSCTVSESLIAGTHQVVIGQITHIRVGAEVEAPAPLVYEQSRFHRLAPI